ncbi:MAG: DNA polymerase I [Erysipelotrichaceae bacterium]|jgi:DNA polymerase-1|nr:DNA polymerase I [Erysipelotrichaceae bacterium]
MNKLIIIDGNSLLFRAYYATSYPPERMMQTKDGTYTNAIVAFANMLLKIMNPLKLGDGICCVFDSYEKTTRHLEDPTYKAQRKPAPPELVMQFPLIRTFLKSLNIPTLEMPGFEGDDLAASISRVASNQGISVNIYTSDKDYLQLVDKNITITILKKGLSDMVKVTENNCEELYGLKPKAIIDFKALSGDPSDNIKGIKGIGEKTAIKLISEHETLEKIYQYALLNQTSKTNKLIVDNIEAARHAYHLATLIDNITLPFTMKDLEYQGYEERTITNFAKRYEMNTFLHKLPSSFREHTAPTSETIYEKSEVLPEYFLQEDRIVIHLEYEKKATNYHLHEPKLIYLATSKTTTIITPNALRDDPVFKRLLSSKSTILATDSKLLIHFLVKNNIPYREIAFDFLLANYLINSERTSDISTTLRLFNSDIVANHDDAYYETAFILIKLVKLYPKLNAELTNMKLDNLYYQVELPLVRTLVLMELEGIYVNKEILETLRDRYHGKLRGLEQKIYALAKHPFNIKSPLQIKAVLFDELQLGKEKSTSEEVLRRYQHYEIVGLILEYRHYMKLLTTYVEGIIPYIDDEGHLHTIFNQTVTATGRLSSSEPNLQNIVIRSEDSNDFRMVYSLRKPDDKYLSLDYSQIELRVLAELSNCAPLIEAFQNKEDIHTKTAQMVYHKEHITPFERRVAKAVNFGIIYGISSWGLANDLDIMPFEATAIINSFKEAFPEVVTFLDKTIAFASDRGYVETMFKRRRYIQNINSNDYMKKEAAKRQAMNAPIQGTASDIIKTAMIKVQAFLDVHQYRTKLVLQIHDELVLIGPIKELNSIKNEIETIMENVVTSKVRLEVDVKIKEHL